MLAGVEKIKQLTMREAADEYNVPYKQLLTACDTGILGCSLNGNRRITTNYAMTKYLMKMTEQVDHNPGREDFDINKALGRKPKREIYNVNSKIKALQNKINNSLH